MLGIVKVEPTGVEKTSTKLLPLEGLPKIIDLFTLKHISTLSLKLFYLFALQYLDDYNMNSSKEMKLVFFMDAIEHVSR